MQYRRSQTRGGTFFFTLVTHRRQQILTLPQNIDRLREAFRSVKKRHPYEMVAVVVLPDHLHCIWTLPEGDNDFSMRWRLLKAEFSRGCDLSMDLPPSASRRKKMERAIWQRRFWEHEIRDEEDYRRHVDYIHYNPVKHGLVEQVSQWPFSSFIRFCQAGFYPESWGAEEFYLMQSQDLGE